MPQSHLTKDPVMHESDPFHYYDNIRVEIDRARVARDQALAQLIIDAAAWFANALLPMSNQLR